MSKKIVGKKTIKEKSSLRFEGIYENGYGLISKSFMKDKRLTIEAKSIYTYLCSYCGGGTTAYPSVALQCSDLCISESRYYKHRQLLLEYGYIKIEQERELVEYEDGTKKEMFSHNVYTIVLNIDREFLEKKAPKKKAIKSKTSKTKSAKSIDMTNNSENTQNEGTQIVGTQNVGNNNNSFNNNSFNNNNINNISSSSKEEDGEKKEADNSFNNDLKTLMAFCNNVNYKLNKEKAKNILIAFGLDKVIKAITTIISTVDTNNIKNYAGYLTATLKDMEATKNITIENKIEPITNNNNKPSNFANFTQRQYDYDKLEAQLLGWDTSDDDYEIN